MAGEEIPSRPSRSLAGKVAIVTGAGCQGNGIGNGRAAAVLLAEDGASVVCADLNLQWAEKTVEMILKDSHGTALACEADITKAEDCRRIVDLAVSKFGRVDILVNNVGVGGARGTAVDVDMEAWAKGLEINVSSMVLMAKYAIPIMKQNEGPMRGSIVNVGSVAGLKGGTPHLLYPTSKGAVVNMTRAMAAHHAPDGIRVNCVCPGMLYTPMMYGPGMSEEAREARKNRSLLRTEGNGWDCGSAIRFLAGGEARWITGTILTVDAGATAAVGTDLPKTASVNAGK
ncbi:conserved hypothetical protein [Uncinocarpus reesii 1704]|uniref:Uncharacterized protein n=1 Tax=Uncinocarpus reesii (strain UAMH 1704) TaxID=336963 RepID=C4JGQ6_UNCRE|nr:uncharacterized protein UREG_02568 [Uncinocarpus reesii 1704]EEP77719.1 conserved hypothetical protein [Uncinocarpus reesii 1704]